MKAFRQLVTASLLLPGSLLVASCSQDTSSSTTPSNESSRFDPLTGVVVPAEATAAAITPAVDAPGGFDLTSNGFTNATDFAAALDVFANEIEEVADGLGPVYNAQSCRECHQNPATGGASQVTELRAGHLAGGTFTEPPGGSLINDRSIDPAFQERIPAGFEQDTRRISLSLFGDGFIEAIDSNDLVQVQAGQPAGQRGTLIQVAVVEAPGQVRAGRFGWKNQQASLLSFAGDAYVNEMGITNPLFPTENTSVGRSVASIDTVPDPEDAQGADIASFTQFMRSLKVPPVDAAAAATASAQTGSNLFNSIGCAVCHVRQFTTVPTGTAINGGQFIVPAALANKVIHPFSDFLLHDVGTGDNIGQGPAAPNLLRTPPLWGMRTRPRLMHDGGSVRRSDAINRHAGQATTARNNFANLSTAQQNNVIDFLNSL